MKTDGSPLHGSYFDLAAAKHPDLKSPESKWRPDPQPKKRRRRLGVLPVVLCGALAGVAWLVIALRPEENAGLTVVTDPDVPAATSGIARPIDAGSEKPAVAVDRETPPRAAVPVAPREVREQLSPEPPTRASAALKATSDPSEERTAEVGTPERREVATPSREDVVKPPDPATVAANATAPPAVALVPARKVFAPQPEYPDAARSAGDEGTVVVRADIDATGVVIGTTIVRGRSPALDAAAAATLETWRFEPATRGGVAIASSYRIGFTFALQEEAAAAPPGASSDNDSIGPLEVGGEVEPPRRLESPLPAYPDSAWAHGVTGDVLVRAVIDENGEVADVEVLRGLPHGLTEAAVAAIRRWKFVPAMRRGQPVAVYRTLSVHFEG